MTADIDFSDSVRVHNTGSVDVVGGFNNRRFRIPPGGSAIVPREAAYVNFGDWTRRDNNPWFPRNVELERIQGRFGIGREGGGQLPDIEITEMDGTRVTLLWEDPEGTKLPEESGRQSIEQQMEAMREEMARLRTRLGEDDPEIPEDSPEVARRSRARAPRIDPADAEVS